MSSADGPEDTATQEPEPTSPHRGWHERVWAQLTVGVLDRVPREHRESESEFRRRRIVSLVTLLVGAVGLAASLRMERDSPWFTLAALAVAAVWLVGALLSGQLHAGRINFAGQLRRPILPPILLGAALAAVFVVGALVTRQFPLLADQATDVLAFAEQNTLPVLAVTTLLSGIAEEFFFRGALYAAIKEPHQVLVTTVAYTIATALTGNIMLAFAAAVLGTITGLQRRSTGGIVAPILTHVTWSMTMLFVLPLIF
jgi:membrane protease YdiL (CAAX protease family)